MSKSKILKVYSDGMDMTREYAVQKIIGYKFKNILLLRRALTHNSYLLRENEGKPVGDYQRLEYLGDALLNFIVAEQIFYLHPNYDEGMLTKVRASIVSKVPLANAIDRAEITNHLYCDVNMSVKMKSDIFESLTAAIYVDSNSLDKTRKFILKLLGEEITNTRVGDVEDFKSKVYEYCAARRLKLNFNLLETSGDPHSLVFTYELMVEGKQMAVESGKTKREAQQKCSKTALDKLTASLTN